MLREDNTDGSSRQLGSPCQKVTVSQVRFLPYCLLFLYLIKIRLSRFFFFTLPPVTSILYSPYFQIVVWLNTKFYPLIFFCRCCKNDVLMLGVEEYFTVSTSKSKSWAYRRDGFVDLIASKTRSSLTYVLTHPSVSVSVHPLLRQYSTTLKGIGGTSTGWFIVLFLSSPERVSTTFFTSLWRFSQHFYCHYPVLFVIDFVAPHTPRCCRD